MMLSQIRSLEDLQDAATARRAVIVRGERTYGLLVDKPRPAQFVMWMAGAIILSFIEEGLFVYEKESRCVTPTP